MSSEKWFQTSGRYSPRITPVEVERHTDASVWINGRRHARISGWECYFPTWKEAHDHLLGEAAARVASARRKLEIANSTYGNIKGMKEAPSEQ